MNRVNLGVVGLGRMGRIFSRHLLGMSRVGRLSAIASQRPQAAREFAQDHDADVRIHGTYAGLFADPDIDGVIIATHTHTHHDLVLEAAAAGKAIFCEKPIALSLAETDTMLQAVADADVPFQVGFMRRFDAGYRAARKEIAAGAIGRPILAQAISRDPGCPDPEWAAPANSGGLILDLAIHDIDILRWLMGDEVEQVFAHGAVLTCPDLAAVGDIDTAVINLRFAGGGLGYVEAARNCTYGYDIRCEIRGSEGTLQIGYLRDTPLIRLNRMGATHDIVPWFEETFLAAYGAQLDHFALCLRDGLAPSPGPTDARRALQIGLAATLSQRETRPVDVDDARDLTL